MKYIISTILTIIIVSLAFLGMSYLVTPPNQKPTESGAIEITQIDVIELLDIKKLIPVHKESSYNKIKNLPPIPLRFDNQNMPIISKIKPTDNSFKLPEKVDFNSSECKFCHKKE